VSRSRMDDHRTPLSSAQQIALVALRSAVGWHFLYEGYYKALLPGWDRAGQPIAEWTAAGYLAAASGPLAAPLHWLSGSPLIGWVEALVITALIAAGLSMLLGLFTQAGTWTALALLSLFYLAQVPLAGRPVPGAEGAYLLVNKTLVEWVAVLTLLVFRTGRIAGLDLLRARGHVGRHFAVGGSRPDARITETSHGAHA
jgi:thiosulfate dehydrogenase (quinone) large subunit